jgi:hypothetical protein
VCTAAAIIAIVATDVSSILTIIADTLIIALGARIITGF